MSLGSKYARKQVGATSKEPVDLAVCLAQFLLDILQAGFGPYGPQRASLPKTISHVIAIYLHAEFTHHRNHHAADG